jgi:drug/metabolite transporter (DMT)-like permease
MPSLFAPKGRAGGAGGVGSAPSEEDGGLTQQRLLILGSHLFLSLAHVFAVHQSAMESAGAEGRDENATRTYAYNPAMVVFLAELIKLVFSVSAYVHMHLKDSPQGNVWVIIRNELEDAFAERRYARFAVPALIYLIENHLRFIVLSRLASPITWVVFSHVEIPIVAALSFYFLRRRIKKHQWIAVFLLLDGVMAAEIALCHAKGDDDINHPSCDSLDAYPVVALSLVLFGATLAALAGIAVEFVYKEHFSMSIHLQNAQLYAFGALANGFVVLFSSSATNGVDGGRGQDDEVLGEDGASFANSTEKALHANDSAFRGFGLVSTWLVVLTLAAFGVVSSLIMKHLSNIAKVFNSAAGMVVVTVVSMVFLGTKVTLPFFLAAATIVASLVSFYGENHGEGGSRGESANRVLGPGSGHVSNGAVSAFTEDEPSPFVTAGTPGTPLSSRGSFAFDAPNANETKQLL